MMVNIEVGVLVSIIAIVVTIIGQALYVAYKIGFISEKIEELAKKQDKHNSTIERTYCVERDVSILQEQIKVANHRIEDLEVLRND